MQGRSLLFTVFGDHVLPHGEEIWTSHLVRLLQEFNFTPQAARVLISRATHQGWLQARKDGRHSYCSLAEKGHRRIAVGQRRQYNEPAWNGQWRLLAFSIPEQNRDVRHQLRTQLAWLGFAPLNGGTWITPRQVEAEALALIQEFGVGRLQLFTARYLGPTENEELLQSCWDVAAIGARYSEFAAAWGPKLAEFEVRRRAREPIEPRSGFVERTTLVHEHRKFLHIDPGLPRELLPVDWPGDTANAIFRRYYGLLSPGAEAFYAAVVGGGEA